MRARREGWQQRQRKILLYFILTFYFSHFFSISNNDVWANTDDRERFGGRIVLSTSTDPKTFNPIVAQEVSSTQILGFVFEGLTRVDPVTGKVIPHLALRWDHDDIGKVWTFHLRQDVYWSDGEKFTARDVLFTFAQLIYNPNVITGYKSIFTIDGKPIHVTVIDDYTVRFTLPTVFAPFLRSLGLSILPQHALAAHITAGTFNEAWGIRGNPRRIVGTGPFTIVHYVAGEKVLLRKNPYYWKRDEHNNQLPYLDEIVFTILQSPDIALLKFKNQEIDLYSVRGIDYPWLKPLEAGGYFTLYNLGPTMSRYFLTLNQNQGINPHAKQPYVSRVKLKWFRNVNFRRALAHSINKEEIINLVYNGLAIPHHSTMSPASGFYFNPDVVTYEFNIKKAQRILAKEGFRDRDNDGVIEDSNGNEVSFNMLLSSGSLPATQLANLIRKDLSDAGFDVNLIQVEFNTLVNKLSFTFDWDMVLMGLTGGVEPHFGANVWFSSGPLHVWYPRQTKAGTEWEARIDDIFRDGVQELDEVKRKELYDEWQRIVAQEVPLIYTVIPLNIIGVNNRLENIEPTPLGGVLHNIEEIYIKKETKQ